MCKLPGRPAQTLIRSDADLSEGSRPRPWTPARATAALVLVLVLALAGSALASPPPDLVVLRGGEVEPGTAVTLTALRLPGWTAVGETAAGLEVVLPLADLGRRQTTRLSVLDSEVSLRLYRPAIPAGPPSLRITVLHGDEYTARAAALAAVASGLGWSLHLEGPRRDRFLWLRDGDASLRLDPNRMFDAPGLRANLRLLNPGLSEGDLHRIIDEVAPLSNELIRRSRFGGLPTIIALHSNTPGGSYGLSSYPEQSVSRRASWSGDDFVLTTDPAAFESLARVANVVLETPAPPGSSDGSLSQWAITNGVRYFNVEVAAPKRAIRGQSVDLALELLSRLVELVGRSG